MTPKEYTFDAAYQPQVRAKRGTREIMLDVIIALLPALVVGVWQFGAQALIPLAVSIVSCVFFEWAYRKLMKKPDSIGDLSAVVTGILLAYTLPANCQWWMPIIGAFFAIVVVKQLYGGIGKNFLNPALAGRAFLLASYALFMNTWVVPSSLASAVDAAVDRSLARRDRSGITVAAGVAAAAAVGAGKTLTHGFLLGVDFHMEDLGGERQQRAEHGAHDAEDGDPFENQSKTKIHISALLSRSSCRRSP